MTKTLGIIPARMASSRFPEKPLKKILDIPMLAHCYERALLSRSCDNLIIASPDSEILDWSKSYDIPSVLTSHSHQRAIERAKEALDILAEQGYSYDLILLLQGDEPQISPDDINNLKDSFTGKDLEAVNLIFQITDDDLEDPNVVKVVTDNSLNIKFFTRSHIPFNSSKTFRQLGMMGFTTKALKHYANLPPTELEELESIDMMRFLENDFCIQGVFSSSPIVGVDNPEDIIKAEKMMLDDKIIHLYKEKYT
tara:strand:+ start:659 stop:1417 length:759 start_codon:yes stop_codon:yes gene_type:complete